MTEKKPRIADISHYYDDLREEGLREERENRGYVWTMQIRGQASIRAMGLASCDYDLDLNCSHVGETMYGVYRGEMAMKFKGEIGGIKLLFNLMGMRNKEDLEGWFRNDAFVMKLKPYTAADEEGFRETFGNTAPEEAADNPAEQLGRDLANNLVNTLLSGITSTYDTAKPEVREEAVGLWYDWDFHMTEGDMGTYLKLNGGPLLFWINAEGQADSLMHSSSGDVKVRTIFGHSFAERYDEPIDSPFPYTIKVFPDYSVLFTLYNYNGSPVTVQWTGSLSRIRVEETVVIKP